MTQTTLPNTPDSPFQSETEGDLSEQEIDEAPQPSEDTVDNAVEETFPASDPISP